MAKPKKHLTGFYRMLWNEYARSIPFTWHRTRKGAETIPRSYKYRDNVSSDYYHQLCEGAQGLEEFAQQSDMVVDWDTFDLRPKERDSGIQEKHQKDE
jgi:hypothetical protein